MQDHEDEKGAGASFLQGEAESWKGSAEKRGGSEGFVSICMNMQ